jgi:hypothetical protein
LSGGQEGNDRQAKGCPTKGEAEKHEEFPDLTDAARARRGSADFLPSFVALQEAVITACAGSTKWEAKVGAGVRAALEFADAHPDAARALTIHARRDAGPQADRERELLRYFTGLLTEVTPAEVRYPSSTDEGLIESIATTVRGHLVSDATAELPALAPEFIYLALMPYTGMAGARSWAETPAGAGEQVRLRTY